MSLLNCAYLYTPLLGCGCYTSVCNVTGVSLKKGKTGGNTGREQQQGNRQTHMQAMLSQPPRAITVF